MRIVLQLGGKPTRRPGRAGRPQAGLRLVLLSLATVILLLGAAIAGIFCYESIGHDLPVAAQPMPAGRFHDVYAVIHACRIVVV